VTLLFWLCCLVLDVQAPSQWVRISGFRVESFRLYDTVTGQTQKILSEYFAIERVQELEIDNGKRALVVEMLDGGLGGPHCSVVDSARGEVFCCTKGAAPEPQG
jgi:hypothetical protein